MATARLVYPGRVSPDAARSFAQAKGHKRTSPALLTIEFITKKMTAARNRVVSIERNWREIGDNVGEATVCFFTFHWSL